MTDTATAATMLNDIDRFHLALDVLDRVSRLRDHAAVAAAADSFRAKRAEHRRYVAEPGEEMAEVRDWRWAV